MGKNNLRYAVVAGEMRGTCEVFAMCEYLTTAETIAKNWNEVTAVEDEGWSDTTLRVVELKDPVQYRGDLELGDFEEID